MSDSVDRVFVHALATVRRLPRTGSSRPPPGSRLRLYGLYKQSMEGDVAAILPRPTLPVSSPDPNTTSTNNNNPNAVHRYASRDLRTREAQAEIEKWDAWHACAGMGRTEAKRQYISTLIETMKEFASGTQESRELVGELEFVWNQIKEQSGSEPDHRSGSNSSPRGSDGSKAKESPTRQLERAGLGRSGSLMNSMDFRSDRPSIGSTEFDGDSSLALGMSRRELAAQKRLQRTESGLRVLSPVSQRDLDDVIEPVEVGNEDRAYGQDDNDDDDDDDNENLNTAPTSPITQRHPDRTRNIQNLIPAPDNVDPSSPLAAWQRNLETHLHSLKTEIAALREQLSANHLLSSSGYSYGASYYTLNTRQRIAHRARLYIRTFSALFVRQFLIQCGILALVLMWGRVKGDLRLEELVRDAMNRFRKKARSVLGDVTFWLLDLFGREGRLGGLGRRLRIF